MEGAIRYGIKMQKEWSDNSVSCTVYYKKQDLPEIKQFLEENFSNNLKTVSFLLYQGHGFKQAPYETISKEVYEKECVTKMNVDSMLRDRSTSPSSGSFTLQFNKIFNKKFNNKLKKIFKKKFNNKIKKIFNKILNNKFKKNLKKIFWTILRIF